jgi:hypothetical protein
MSESLYPRFSQALGALPAEDAAEADALQLSTKSLRRYRKGRFPKALRFLVQRPALLRALIDDVESTPPTTEKAAA